MISVIVYMKYQFVYVFAWISSGWLSCCHMCAATVGWRNLRVAGRSADGSGGVVGQKEHSSCELVSNVRAGGCMKHEHPSHSSFIGGKGTGGQKGRQYFGYPGQDPNSPSQQIQIPCSPWNFAMCCFHGLARCPCIARNIKMHFFTKHLLWLTHAGVIPFCKN